MTGGDLVVGSLNRLGVEIVFGIPSVHNLPIYDAIRRDGRIRAVTVRHEQTAVAAADAYARATGKLGVCITSTGAGAANAMGGLVEARTSSSPVLHITGQIDSRFFGQGRGFIHEVPDQAGMLASICTWSKMATTTDGIPSLLAEAATAALRPRQGPVTLEIPIDLQYAEGTADVEAAVPAGLVAAALADTPGLDEAALGAAVEALRAAERPLVWAGGGAVASGAAGELSALARSLGAGVITSPNGRGVLPEDDPLCIGNLPWDEEVRSLCVDADVLLAVGTRFQGPNTQNWQMQLPATIIQIDVDAAVPGRNYPVAVTVIGDAKEALAAISSRLGAADAAPANAEWAARVADAAGNARKRLRSTLGAQEGLLDALAAALPDGAVVVKDSTIPAYTWGNRLLPVGRERTAIMPNGFAIGLGVPHLVGAAAAHLTRPAVLMVGDGGFMLAPGELATLSEERLPAVILLFNDGGYGILRNIQEKQYGEKIGVELGRPDFCALARSMGVEAERVGSAEGFAKALEAAFAGAASGVPQLVEVDLDEIGPMAVPFIGTSRPPQPR
ncbi:MAG TPA: thiamine pyrophosphate-binding protein [Acidimicrobiales bacterium]|nr:thiamine pyrophosphate-binding protein [Acidimicrobiales bacterium]